MLDSIQRQVFAREFLNAIKIRLQFKIIVLWAVFKLIFTTRHYNRRHMVFIHIINHKPLVPYPLLFLLQKLAPFSLLLNYLLYLF